MDNKKTFLLRVLEHCDINKNRAAVLLGWDAQRVWYLCSDKAKGFPLAEIPNLRDKLGISRTALLKLLDDYLFG